MYLLTFADQNDKHHESDTISMWLSNEGLTRSVKFIDRKMGPQLIF